MTMCNLRSLIALSVLLAPQAASSTPRDPLAKVDEFNVVFTSPSKDEADSVPMGNGAIGINLWVEENGDLLFYISSNDTLSEMNRLFKFGRVRVSLRANPFVAGNPYKQTLHLRDGCCDIIAGSVGLKVFVDAEGPTIYVAGSQQPLQVKATLENWRRHGSGLGDSQWRDPLDPHLRGGQPKGIEIENLESADVMAEPAEGRDLVSPQLAHAGAAAPEVSRTQSLAGVVADTIKNRTLGATIAGEDSLQRQKTLMLEKPSQHFELRVTTHVAQTETATAFFGQLKAHVQGRWIWRWPDSNRTADWWNAYWDRSWIFWAATNTCRRRKREEAARIPFANHAPTFFTNTRRRASREGSCRRIFGGGIFSVHRQVHRPWLRKSTGGIHARFHGVRRESLVAKHAVALPVPVAQGNFDFMMPLFNFYFRNRPVFEGQAKLIYGADGLYMNECVSRFWLPAMVDFGWNAKEYSNGYTRNIWQDSLEFGTMALDYYDYTGDAQFLKQTVAWCDQSLRFFDTRFKRDEHGRIVICPTHAVETYWKDVTNDMPSRGRPARNHGSPVGLAGKSDRRPRSVPAGIASPVACRPFPRRKTRMGWLFPMRRRNTIPVAATSRPRNFTASILSAFMGLAEWLMTSRRQGALTMQCAARGISCWVQTGLFAARLGLTAEAKRDIEDRTRPEAFLRVRTERKSNRYFRFPGFWGSPFDYCPDYDGPGNMANTLQEMLLQPGPNGKLLLFPAWPKDWDVDFKLHAPRQTTIEGVYRAGRLERLTVIPESRRKDVVIHQ